MFSDTDEKPGGVIPDFEVEAIKKVNAKQLDAYVSSNLQLKRKNSYGAFSYKDSRGSSPTLLLDRRKSTALTR